MNSDLLPCLNKPFQGDCRELLGSLPDECVDLVVSSPPYNLGKEYEAKRALQHYLDEQKQVLAECVRVLKPSGSIFWQVGAFSDKGQLIPLDIRFFPILEDLGMLPRNRIVWVRQHGLHARNKFSARHETILWFTKSDDYVFNLDPIRVPQKYPNKKHHKGNKHGELSCNPRGKNPGDIWLFRNVKHNHEERTIHPCQFPEDLVSRIVLCASPEGGVVLDPYSGAGTTAVVAKNHGRSFLVAEKDEMYHSTALRRLSGDPDESGTFPNLKTLRDHCELENLSVDEFTYDVQVGKKATPRRKMKVQSEEQHKENLFSRLEKEETAFSKRLNRDTPPEKTRDDPQTQENE